MPDRLPVTITAKQWDEYERTGRTLVPAPTVRPDGWARDLAVAFLSLPPTESLALLDRTGVEFTPERDGRYLARHWERAALRAVREQGAIDRLAALLDVQVAVPVPATEPCPEADCRGGQVSYPEWEGQVEDCLTCNGSGVVPRVVVVVRPERECPTCRRFHDEGRFQIGWTCPRCFDGEWNTHTIPAEQVGTATVTAVPVVDAYNVGEPHEMKHTPHIQVAHGSASFWPTGWSGEHIDVTHLFPTPPKPGETVWRLDKENDRG